LAKQTTNYNAHGKAGSRDQTSKSHFRSSFFSTLTAREKKTHMLHTSALFSYTEGSGCAPDFMPQGHNGLVCKHKKSFIVSPLPYIDIANNIVLNYRMAI